MLTMSLPEADAFDKGAEALWEARARGEKLFKPDIAAIFRTTYLAFQVAHPKEAKPPKRKTVSRARNPWFDALAEATGSNPSILTRTGAKTIGVALAEIMEVSPNITPESIHQAAAAYKRNHPDWPLTATALSKHWGECFGASRQTRSAKKDIYVEPPNWRAAAHKLYPEAKDWITSHDFDSIEWLKVNPTIREEIIKVT